MTLQANKNCLKRNLLGVGQFGWKGLFTTHEFSTLKNKN